MKFPSWIPRRLRIPLALAAVLCVVSVAIVVVEGLVELVATIAAQ